MEGGKGPDGERGWRWGGVGVQMEGREEREKGLGEGMPEKREDQVGFFWGGVRGDVRLSHGSKGQVLFCW